MNDRKAIATAAMQAILQSSFGSQNQMSVEQIAAHAYLMADAMLSMDNIGKVDRGAIVAASEDGPKEPELLEPQLPPE